MLNAVANNFEAPLLIVVNQYDRHVPKLKLNKSWFESEVFSVASRPKTNFEVAHVNLKSLMGTKISDPNPLKAYIEKFIESTDILQK